MLRRRKTCFGLLLVLVLSVPLTVFGCQCTLFSPCVAYSEANAVFIGTILDVKDDPSPSVWKNKIVRFAVEKRFKGTGSTEEVVNFMQDNCAGRTLLTGEKYVVYMNSSNVVGLCNRTHLVKESSSDLAYLTNLSFDNPIFTIRGFIPRLSPREIDAFRVVIRDGENKITRRLDDKGQFEVVLRKWGVHEVSLKFPFEVGSVEMTSGMLGYEAQATSSKNRTVASYDVESAPNYCDDRMVLFERVK